MILILLIIERRQVLKDTDLPLQQEETCCIFKLIESGFENVLRDDKEVKKKVNYKESCANSLLMYCTSFSVRFTSIAFALLIACSLFLAPANTTVIPG